MFKFNKSEFDFKLQCFNSTNINYILKFYEYDVSNLSHYKYFKINYIFCLYILLSF